MWTLPQDHRPRAPTPHVIPWLHGNHLLALALGIGFATAGLTVANALLLRRLSVTDQNRLLVVHVPLGIERACGSTDLASGFYAPKMTPPVRRRQAHKSMLAEEILGNTRLAVTSTSVSS